MILARLLFYRGFFRDPEIKRLSVRLDPLDPIGNLEENQNAGLG